MVRAIRLFEFGGPEVLKLQLNVAVPILKDHQVLTKSKHVVHTPWALIFALALIV